VITPLARPRIPSVPKYLRAIIPTASKTGGDLTPICMSAASKNIQ
jgi:hypothetical protein